MAENMNLALESEIKAYELRWQNTQRVLSKADKFITTTPTGEFKSPGFFSVLANWKTIAEILIMLLQMFIEPKTSPYWDGGKNI